VRLPFGDQDNLLPLVEKFIRKLDALKIDHQFEVRPVHITAMTKSSSDFRSLRWPSWRQSSRKTLNHIWP
jgi:hypothetical protein